MKGLHKVSRRYRCATCHPLHFLITNLTANGGGVFMTCAFTCIGYSSVKYWNSLPDHFRKTVDYSEFKRKLLVHGFS